MWFDLATNEGGNLKDLMKKIEFASRGQSTADDVVAVCATDVVMRPLDWILGRALAARLAGVDVGVT
jgi:hypothetical protein